MPMSATSAACGFARWGHPRDGRPGQGCLRMRAQQRARTWTMCGRPALGRTRTPPRRDRAGR